MVRESMVTIYQGMHSNLGDLPSILFFYVFPVRTRIITLNSSQMYHISQKEDINLYVSLFRYT